MKGRSLNTKALFIFISVVLLAAVTALFCVFGFFEYNKNELPKIVLSTDKIVAVSGETKTISAVLVYPDGRMIDADGELEFRSLDTEYVVFQNEKTGVFRVLEKQLSKDNVSVDVVVTLLKNTQVSTTVKVEIVQKSSKITFDYNGATAEITDTDKKVGYLQKVDTLPKPKKSGYVFRGWYTSENISVKIGESYPFEEDVTLYAAWTKNDDYYVEYNSNVPDTASTDISGTMPNSMHYYGTEKNLSLNSFVLPGWTFDKWSIYPDGSGNNYADGEEVVDIMPEVADGIILYAQWTPNTYTVTYNYNGADSGNGNSSAEVTFDNDYNLATPARKGYTFTGWYTSLSGGTKYADKDGNSISNWTDLADLTLYANWTANSYTVTYNYDGATGDNSDLTATVIFDETFTLAVPKKEGFIFAGWYQSEDGGGHRYTDENGTSYGEKWQDDKDLQLYACWLIVMRFNYEDATTQNGNAYIEILEGTQVGTLPQPEKTGYTFSGWWTQACGEGSEYVSTTLAPALSVDLYAKWVMTISFDYQQAPSDGLQTSKDVIYKTKLGTLPSPTKTGNTFEGWYTEVGGGGVPYYASTTLNASDTITLYVKWATTIAFDAQSGSCAVTDINVVFEKAVNHNDEFPTPERRHFTFIGWYTGTGAVGDRITSDTVYRYDTNITVYAAWKTTIQFDAQGGEIYGDTSKDVIWSTEIGSLSSAEYTGHKFMGWYTNIGGSGSLYTSETIFNADKNITLYAFWTVEKYLITFDSNGGSAVDSKECTFGSSITYDSPVRDGYNFSGWYNVSTSKLVSGTKVSDLGDWDTLDVSAPIPVTLKAKWSQMSATEIGSGTGDSPYVITHVLQLEDLATKVNSGESFEGIYFVLDKDLKIADDAVSKSSAANWAPIGNNDGQRYSVETDYQFKGIFDGGNYTISNYRVKTSGTDTYGGLFGYIGIGGVVKNLKVGGFFIDGVSSRTGGTKGGTHHGGIAGITSGLVENCTTVSGTIDGGNSSTLDTHHGGIVGYMFKDGSVIEKCTNNATVTGTATRWTSHGGIAGSANNSLIFMCQNNGTVTGSTGVYAFHGGIAGVNAGLVLSSVNAATITTASISAGNTGAYNGTIVGYLHDGSSSANNGDAGDNTLKITGYSVKVNSTYSAISAVVNCTSGTGSSVSGISAWRYTHGNVLVGYAESTYSPGVLIASAGASGSMDKGVGASSLGFIYAYAGATMPRLITSDVTYELLNSNVRILSYNCSTKKFVYDAFDLEKDSVKNQIGVGVVPICISIAALVGVCLYFILRRRKNNNAK